MAPLTVLVAVSSTATVPSAPVTYSRAPPGAATTPVGESPTSVTVLTALVANVITETLSPPVLVT